MDTSISGCGYLKNNGLGGLDFVQTENLTIETTGVTEEGGFCYGRGRRLQHDDGHVNFMAAYFKKPNVESCECSAKMVYNAVPATVYEVASAQSCRVAPKWVSQSTLSFAMLTSDELAAITDPDPQLPASGMSYSLSLIQQRGVNNYGYASEMTGLVPFNIDDDDDVMYRSYPLQYSYTVKTAESANLMNMEFSALLKTDIIASDGYRVPLRVVAENEACTVHIVRTEMFLPSEPGCHASLVQCGTVPCGNDAAVLAVYDRWTHVDPNNLDSYCWLPLENPLDGVDPNILNDPNIWCDTEPCDPNILIDWDDPNFYDLVLYTDTTHPRFGEVVLPQERIHPVHIIPIGEENDELRIQFTPDVSCLVLGAPSWLTDDKRFDFNGDGVVNLKDIFNF
jgi:hypothetical protein